MADPNWPDFVLGLRAERDARHPAKREEVEALIAIDGPLDKARAFLVHLCVYGPTGDNARIARERVEELDAALARVREAEDDG